MEEDDKHGLLVSLYRLALWLLLFIPIWLYYMVTGFIVVPAWNWMLKHKRRLTQ